jgi:hypothetical protein
MQYLFSAANQFRKFRRTIFVASLAFSPKLVVCHAVSAHQPYQSTNRKISDDNFTGEAYRQYESNNRPILNEKYMSDLHENVTPEQIIHASIVFF